MKTKVKYHSIWDSSMNICRTTIVQKTKRPARSIAPNLTRISNLYNTPTYFQSGCSKSQQDLDQSEQKDKIYHVCLNVYSSSTIQIPSFRNHSSTSMSRCSLTRLLNISGISSLPEQSAITMTSKMELLTKTSSMKIMLVIIMQSILRSSLKTSIFRTTRKVQNKLCNQPIRI